MYTLFFLFFLFIFVVGGINVKSRQHQACLLVGIRYWRYLFPTNKSDVGNFLELIEVGLAIFLTQFELINKVRELVLYFAFTQNISYAPTV